MRLVAYGLLLIVLLPVIIEPLVEVSYVLKEKIAIGSAISNASRSAKNRSLIMEDMRNLDARVDQDLFKDYFAEAFADALNLTKSQAVGNTLTFVANDAKYDDFVVILNFANKTDSMSGRVVSEVHVEAKTTYKYKTAYLRMADNAFGLSNYELVSERMLLLEIRN